MTVSAVLSLLNLASVGVFGIVLSAAFCDLEWTRQRKGILAVSTVLMLALQAVVSLHWGTGLARYLYPVITHLPLFLLLAVLSVVLGIVMVVDPFGTMETLVMAIGLILILEGALNLLSALYTMLAVRRFIKLHPETQSMLEAITGQDLNGDGVIAPDVSHADVESTAVELDYVDESAEVEQEEE